MDLKLGIRTNCFEGMKRFSFIFIVCSMLSSCYRMGDDVGGEFIILPGDVIKKSCDVSIVSSNGKTPSNYSYSINLMIFYDKWEGEYVPINRFDGTNFYWPSGEYLERFGDNADYVKSEFRNLTFAAKEGLDIEWDRFHASTVFPMGQIKVYANDIVNGVAAGEDLLDQFWLIQHFPGKSDFPINTIEPVTSLSIDDPKLILDELLDNNCLYHWRFYINSSDSNMTPISERKDIIFTFTVPVRKVLILQWINDRKDNHDAPMPYIDTELTWRISTKTGQLN